MIILGIETSCDETSVAIVKNGFRVIDQITSSQISLHAKYSGVVPEIASRAHLENINWMLEKITDRNRKKYDAIAVTCGPGLVGSLLIGHVTAEMLSYVMKVPLVEVNHIEGHVFSPFLGKKLPGFPFLSLIVSGGHTELILVESMGRFKVIGRTRDDACGEAYDKVAKLLGFGYPGGPEIDRIYASSNPEAYQLPRAVLPGVSDFSFSGLKTAVLYKLREIEKSRGADISPQTKNDLAASFQKSAVGVLVKKTVNLAVSLGIKTIALGGGVSANSLLRREISNSAKSKNIRICLPEKANCMDNAAMIASAGYYKWKFYSGKDNPFKYFSIKGVNSSAHLENW